MLPIFKQKPENKFTVLTQLAEENFLRIPHEEPRLQYEFGAQEVNYAQYQLHQGPGGFGKTYARL